MVLEMLKTLLSGHYELFLIVAGIVGIVLAIERLLHSDDDESKLVKVVSILIALVMFALVPMMIILINKPSIYSNYTLFLLIVFGLALLAHPLKELPLAFISLAVIVLLVIILFAIIYKRSTTLQDIPLEIFAIVIGVALIIVFIGSFFFEKILDGFFAVLGWSPIILALALLTLAQGAMVYILGNHYGMLSFFGLGS